jgi:hypothetical protein
MLWACKYRVNVFESIQNNKSVYETHQRARTFAFPSAQASGDGARARSVVRVWPFALKRPLT